MNVIKCFLVLLLCLFVNSVHAQTNSGIQKDSTYLVKLTDETSFMGVLVSMTDSTYSFQTKLAGQITVYKSQVSEIKLAQSSSLHSGKYWFANPNATRYFFSPSALNLKGGEGYYQNNYIFLNSIYVGIADYVTIGGGFEFISLFATGSPGPLYFLTLKGGAPVAKNLHLGAGILFAGVPSSFGSGNVNYDHFGIGFGLVTYGNTDHNLTFGFGKGFENGKTAERPVFTISGMTRVSKKVSFVTENWLIPVTKEETVQEYNSTYNTTYYSSRRVNTYPLYFSYGFRFFGEKLSVDLGFINSAEIAKAIFIGIPYVDFVVKF